MKTLLLISTLAAAPLLGESWAIDPARSQVTIQVGKTGAFSAFGDEHQVRAPIESGTVSDDSDPRVEVVFDARGLKVLDPKLAPAKRDEVQKRMLGPEVLDAERSPRIRFRSTKVTSLAADRWRVEGTLELRGRTGPVTFEIARREGLFRGSAAVRQTAFGIKPITAGAGTVKVKDELRVDLEIAVSGSGSETAPAR